MSHYFFENKIDQERYQYFIDQCEEGKENNEGEVAHLHLSESSYLICKGNWITLSISLNRISIDIDYKTTEFLLAYSNINRFHKIFKEKLRELNNLLIDEIIKNETKCND